MLEGTVGQAVVLMLRGMGGIFAVLGLIALLVCCLQKLDEKKGSK